MTPLKLGYRLRQIIEFPLEEGIWDQLTQEIQVRIGPRLSLELQLSWNLASRLREKLDRPLRKVHEG